MPNIITQYHSVPIPREVQIVSLNIGWSNPGQIVHRSAYTGDEIIIQRGVGRLFGDVRIGETNDRAEAMEIESWISALSDPAAVCEIPLHREFPVNYSNSVSSVGFSNGKLITSLSSGIGSLRKGHYVRIGSRVLIVSELFTNNRVVLIPQVTLSAGSRVVGADTVRVKAQLSTSPYVPRIPDWYGPWFFNWIEVPNDVEVDTSHFDSGDILVGGHVDSHSDSPGPPHTDSHLDTPGDPDPGYIDHNDHNDHNDGSDPVHGDRPYIDDHGDINHIDNHDDANHGDRAYIDDHGDIHHVDNHDDTDHGDRAYIDDHGDLNHSDNHNDENHGDRSYIDDHYDTNMGGHQDNHFDDGGMGEPGGEHEDQHTDENPNIHGDTHVDTEHADSPHNNNHQDVSFGHGDRHYDDMGFTEGGGEHEDQHNDYSPNTHGDIHVDIDHVDSGHVDDHQDVSFGHGDRHYDDMGFGEPGGEHEDQHNDYSPNTHGDIHVDIDHIDSGHVDDHQDVSFGHGDRHYDDMGFTEPGGEHEDQHNDYSPNTHGDIHVDIDHVDSGSYTDSSGISGGGGSSQGGVLTFVGGSDGSDAINPSSITWIDTNITNWSRTSRITEVRVREVPAGGICIEHTKADNWPGVQTTGGSNLAGNPWIVARINDTWYAGTYEWLRPGQICKLQVGGSHGLPSAEIRTHVTGSPLNNWTPQRGEVVGFIVSTPARFGPEGSLRERSQIVLVTWP